MALAPAARPTTTTAEDPLKRRGAKPNIVSGAHLVAKALAVEGMDLRHERVAVLAL